MKPISAAAVTWLVLLAPATSAAEAESPSGQPRRVPMRDAPTYEDVVAKSRKAAALADPMQHLEKAEGPDPSTLHQPEDLLTQSDIICFNGMATLVPKRAILATPSAHRERLSFQPGARIVPWGEFYQQNRGWIMTVEVSRIQAEGKQPFPEDTSTRIQKSRNLVVATFQGGPISVLPLQVPAEAQPGEPAPPPEPPR